MRDLSAARSLPLVTATRGVDPLPAAARFILRGGPEVRAAVEPSLDFSVPETPCRALTRGARAALWLGPDEWLLLAPEADGGGLAATLGAGLRGLPHSLVDVSHRQGALRVGGAHAVTLLAAGCPLDLDAAAFPVGMCTRTMLAKAEVVLWRTAGEEFRLEVWRSFMDYVSQFLAEAARGII
jgi:sarcosine oxidase, subunit gamma